MSTMKTAFLTALVLAMTLFVGCGSSNGSAEISDAVNSYFTAIGSGDWQTMYDANNKAQQEKMDGIYKTAEAQKNIAKANKMMFGDAKVLKCEDIKIDGDNATAMVTFSIGKNEQSKEFTFAKEEGVWKIQG